MSRQNFVVGKSGYTENSIENRTQTYGKPNGLTFPRVYVYVISYGLLEQVLEITPFNSQDMLHSQKTETPGNCILDLS
jgi:hypothetical protein